MPRGPRQKHDEAIYHVMGRSLTEIDLFPSEEDKEYFLEKLKKYKEKTKIKILGFCLMTNHYHIHVDPCGYDISKLMQRLNLSYVKYINKKYKRKGPLFDDRFNSKIIDSDNYNLVVSAYIHLNPKDIEGYRGKEFDYPYSSMGIYLGKHKDTRDIIDSDFILSCINEKDKISAIKTYVEFICNNKSESIDVKLKEYEDDFENGRFEYKSDRQVIFRDKDPEKVIQYLAKKFDVKDVSIIMNKWRRSAIEFRSVLVYALNIYCGLSFSQICKIFYNITSGCCSRLCKKGFELVRAGGNFSRMLSELPSAI